MNLFKHLEDENVSQDTNSLVEYLSTIKLAFEVMSFLQAKGCTKSQSFNVVSLLLELLRDIKWK